ncbi:transposase [Aeromonas hydrophila]|uniref:transposase n=1 Tax=Aeromonas hydrophila TaxID=644 RepID=UPI0024416032|nr:transposase [Aeromonas hydrophila]
MGKTLYPITNWAQYNKSLISRGSLTFWVDAAAMNNWFHHDHHGRWGRNPLYTDQTICTFLMLKGIFRLTLRATQGLLDSMFEFMNVPLCGANDSKASHQLIAYKGARACIPPRNNAGLWKKGHSRNEAVLVMRKDGLAHWKRISGYHRRSLAETAMSRFKQLMTGKITLRKNNGQVGEVMAYVRAINKLMEWSPLPKTASNVPKWRMKLPTD